MSDPSMHSADYRAQRAEEYRRRAVRKFRLAGLGMVFIVGLPFTPFLFYQGYKLSRLAARWEPDPADLEGAGA